MVRLTHLRGSLRGTSSTSPKAIIRIGRGQDCDVRFDPRVDTQVSTHHAEIRFEDGNYFLIDTGSTNGTLLNGKPVRKQRLRSGDKIDFGGERGPGVQFEIDSAGAGSMNGGSYGMPQAQRRAPPRVEDDK